MSLARSQESEGIQLQEINSNFVKTFDDDDSSDEVQYSKVATERVEETDNHVEELPPLSGNVSVSDVMFNLIVFLVVFLNLITDITLVFYHYGCGDKWASGLTAGVVGFGGIVLLKQFWGVTYEQLDRIYTSGTCVRVTVNCFPWMATLITSYQVTSSSVMSRSNPMIINRYVKLQELLQSFLRAQGVAQAAPQAVLQLVVLLEGVQDVSWFGATLLLTSISTSLTLMMVSNLPLKTEGYGEGLKRAAHNPYTRLFIGLRMVSSFGSRTLALSLVFSTSRCVSPLITSSPSPLISHGIPLSIILLPRILFTLTEYICSRTRKQNSEPPRPKSKFSDILYAYAATIFIVFSDPLWIFWYGTIESISFILFFAISEFLTGCLGVTISITVFALFIVLFCVVPFAVPVIRERVRTHHR